MFFSLAFSGINKVENVENEHNANKVVVFVLAK